MNYVLKSLLLLVVGLTTMNLSAQEFPNFEVNQEFLISPYTTRLTVHHHCEPTEWGQPNPNERHTHFYIEKCVQDDQLRYQWIRVGEILTQFKKDPSIGTHVRIRSIEVYEEHRNQGVAKIALLTLFRAYEKTSFSNFKLEVNITNLHAKSLFKHHGFTEMQETNYPDVVNMIRPSFL
jgi:ribosomal protein S18 acetylase RimI-like enzyme